MPLKPCLEPGCGSFSSYRGRCSEHARMNDKSMHRAGRSLYSTKRWGVTRRRKLSETPICERCNKELADTVHHRVDLADGGDEYAMSNLASLCTPCHSVITRQRQVAST